MGDHRGDHGGRRDGLVDVDGTEIHYSDWGDPDADPVVCVHGFSRTGRDFDDLAAALADDYRVLCPDVPGRGLSEVSQSPGTDYTGEALAASIAGFADAMGIDAMRWVGTSMGGAMGIRLAGSTLRDRITHLVLNDIGPGPVEDEGERGGTERISDYLANPPTVRTLTELEDYFRDIYGANKPNADLRRLALTSARRTDDGHWTPNYDPEIVAVRFDDPEPRDLWDEWDAVGADTLVLRGAASDVLSEEELAEMTRRRPAEVVEYPGIGHAPSLASTAQIEAVADFLSGPPMETD